MNKRISILSILLGTLLILELAGLFTRSGVVQGVSETADHIKTYATASREDSTIIPGDIYDRNGELIAESKQMSVFYEDEEGNRKKKTTFSTSYTCAKAYSQFIGYTGTRELNLNAESTEEVVGDRNAYRLMDFLSDESYWGENGLYSTVNGGKKGQSAVLTLDNGLEQATYEALCRNLGDTNEEIGSAVVMDAKTGAILSIVSLPAYDFNDLSVAKAEMINADEALEAYYPASYKNGEAPGSIFKIFMACALLEHDLGDMTVTNKTLNMDGTKIKRASYCSSSLQVAPGDTMNLETALNISSNVYFAQAALTLGADAIRETAARFMFPDVNESYISSDFGYIEYNLDLNVSETQLATTGFGQGKTEWTAVSAAMVAQAIANGGNLMQPYCVERLFDENGKTTYEGSPELLSVAVSEETARTVACYMRSTATECCNLHHLSEVKEVFDKYLVAGKTGTAENGDGTNNAWYVSFAPYDDPKYVVVVNHCRVPKKYGYKMMGTVAEIYEYLFNEYE